MSYNQIFWSTLTNLVPIYEILGVKYCYLARINTAIDRESIVADYVDRTNQVRLTLQEDYPKSVIVNDRGEEYTGSEFLFKAYSRPDDYFNVLFITDGYNNIGYLNLAETINPSIASNYFLNLTLVIIEKIVIANVVFGIDQIDVYSPIETEFQPEYRYRGLGNYLLTLETSTEYRHMFGMIGKEVIKSNSLKLYDIPSQYNLGITNSIVFSRVISVDYVSYLYIVISTNSVISIDRYNLITSTKETLITGISSINSAAFIVPYINGVLIRNSNGTYSFIYYNTKLVKTDNGYGFRVHENVVYTNTQYTVYNERELGILKSIFTSWSNFNIYYISSKMVVYSTRSNPNIRLTRYLAYEDSSLIRLDLSVADRYDLIDEIGSNVFYLRNIGKGTFFYFDGEILVEDTFSNMINKLKVGSLDTTNLNFSIPSNRLNIIPIGNIIYYLHKYDTYKLLLV